MDFSRIYTDDITLDTEYQSRGVNGEMNDQNLSNNPDDAPLPKRMPIPRSMRSNKHLIGLVFYNFCRRTTVHGVNHLLQVKNQRGRIFWLFIVSAAALGFTVNLFHIIEKYLQYQVLSNTYHDHELFEFPEISFCNLNPIFVPPVGTKEYANLLQWITEYPKILQNKYLASSFLVGLTDFLFIQRKPYSHPGWSLIAHCRYQTKNCSWKNFTPISLWPYGTCFIFNPLSLNMSRRANTTPIYKGYRPNFEVILYKGVDFPSQLKNDPHNTITMPSGVIFMLHEPESYPFIFEGYLVDFFSVVDVKITRKFHEPNLKPCIKTRTNYTYFDTVTNSSKTYLGRWIDCIYHIIQYEVQKSCNCVLEFYPISAEFRDLEFCKSSIFRKSTESLMQCLSVAFNAISKKEKLMNLCYKDLCNHSSYTTVISQAKYPAVEERNSEMVWLKKLAEMEAVEKHRFGKSDLASKSLLNNSNLTLQQAYRQSRKDLLDKDFVDRNFMLLRVVAQSLFMDRVEEVEEYPISRLLSDIGGCVGLWLGASLITVFELFDLLLDSAEILYNNPYYRYKSIHNANQEAQKRSIKCTPTLVGNEDQRINFNITQFDKWKDDTCCHSPEKQPLTNVKTTGSNCLVRTNSHGIDHGSKQSILRKKPLSEDYNIVSSV